MRTLERPVLLAASNTTLSQLQGQVDATVPLGDRAAHAAELWKRKTRGKKRRAAFEDVGRKLRAMSSGRERCMYCEDSAGTDIDHFRPKSTYPEHAFEWRNYLWACAHCNSNQKRALFPLDPSGDNLLLDPTVDDPYEHIAFVPETGHFEGITPRGVETVAVFGLQRREILPNGRRDAWHDMTARLREYDHARKKKDAATQKRIIEVMRSLSFQSVVQHYLRDALAGSRLIPLAIRRLVQKTTADWTWAVGGRVASAVREGSRP